MIWSALSRPYPTNPTQKTIHDNIKNITNKTFLIRKTLIKSGTSWKCSPILPAQNCTLGIGITTALPIPTLVLRECKDTKCSNPWALTHSVCPRKTMQSRRVFTPRIPRKRILKQCFFSYIFLRRYIIP